MNDDDFADGEEASRLTTIDDIPSEILRPIIGCLPYNERLNVTGVSSRWHSMIDQMLGRKLFIGRHCQYTPEDEERYRHNYVPIETLSKMGVNSCYVGEVVDPTMSMSNLSYYWTKLKETFFGQNIPTFKHPYLVKNIFFDGPIPSKYFDSIIRPTKNLERLDIHMSSLCNLNPEDMEFPMKNKLDTLNIWGHKMTQGIFTSFYSPLKIVGNLMTLLERNEFQSLKNLGIEYPFDLGDESRVTDKVLDFLKAHGQTIEKLKLCINLFITEEPTGLENADDRIWVQKAKAVSRTMTALRNIEVTITSIYRVRLTKMWTGFIESQTSLETVALMTFKLLPDILYRICEQNHETLTSIALTRLILNENGRFTSINCSVFQACINLKSLFLEAMQTGLQSPGLFELQNLPKSIERFDLGNIMVLSEDFHTLFTNLPNLKDVYLSDAGHGNNLGVAIPTVNQIILNHTIQNVTLYASLNGRLPEEGISNGHPVSPVMITPRPFGMLEITLNEDGYYRNVPRENLSYQFIMDDMN